MSRNISCDRAAELLYTGRALVRLCEIRALRIYEGASEVQKLIIAHDLLKPPQDIPS